MLNTSDKYLVVLNPPAEFQFRVPYLYRLSLGTSVLRRESRRFVWELDTLAGRQDVEGRV
jgi:hypothetical protein